MVVLRGTMNNNNTMNGNDYAASIQKAIPAEWHMISGSHDSQTSADAYNVGKFQLPNPAGKAGGACTSALLQVLYRDGHEAGAMSWVEALRKMRVVLNGMGFNVRAFLCLCVCLFCCCYWLLVLLLLVLLLLVLLEGLI